MLFANLMHILSRYEDPVIYPGARTIPPVVHDHILEEKPLVSCSKHHMFLDLPITNARERGASTSRAPSRGKMLHEDTCGARTRSLSPRKRGHDFASGYASPGGDRGFGPWSAVKRMIHLKSQSQPLPLPPVPIAGFRVPSSSPIASAKSQSQWKKGKLLGSGTFGQVYLGFNRYDDLQESLF